MYHDRPFTPEQFTKYMNEMGWTMEEIAEQLGFTPPDDWRWRCLFCEACERATE